MYSLGMEFSTQSVKLVVLDLKEANVTYSGAFDYDSTFPEYQTQGGILKNDHTEVRHTSPYMLIQALDFAFEKLKKDDIDMSLIRAIKIDCMQHCTVYTDKTFESSIMALNPELDLVSQLGPSISRKTSPVWEDRSPLQEVQYLTSSLNDQGGISAITGNRAELRFPAAQVMRWTKESPEEFSRTASIFLLSAFITSILSGKVSPVDTGDGWGTNLNNLDIDNPGWSTEAIHAVDSYLDGLNLESLENKIGMMDHYDSLAGEVDKYFVQKYGFDPNAVVLIGTGDNPATLLGCGGKIVISLGSSYTVNGIMEKIYPSPSGEYNVFGYTKGRAMALSVFTNGGKVHEHFLSKYFKQKDWGAYSRACGKSILNKDEKLLLPYLFDESVPLSPKGIKRDGFSGEDPEINIRALHVSQALSLKLHSTHLDRVDDICIVGGGAGNHFLRQLISDIFETKIHSINNANVAAPLGCAMSGAKVLLNTSYGEVIDMFVRRDDASNCYPQKENKAVIHTLLRRYHDLESKKQY